MKYWCSIGLFGVVGWISSPNQHEGFYPIAKPLPLDHRNIDIDSCGNRWILQQGTVHVYPAQSRNHAKVVSPQVHVSHLATDSHGHVWALGNGEVYVLDPRLGNPNWMHTDYNGTFLTRSSDGRALIYNGEQLEYLRLSRKGIPSKESSTPLPDAESFMVDYRGKTYAKTLHGNYGLEASDDAWQQDWIEVGNLPGSNHDISGDILESKFYIAGGLTAEWGFPGRSKVYDEVLCFDPEAEQWKPVANLMHPRRYNATSYLDGEIWVIGGDQGKQKPPLETVEIVNLKTGQLRNGPSLPFAVSICTAHNVHGRLFVLGRNKESPSMHNFFSIGKSEEDWKTEPIAPEVSGPIVSTSDEEHIYVVIPHTHLAIYKVRAQEWTSVTIPKPPRSCQIALHKGELWLMGGRGVAEEKVTQVYNLATGTWREGPKLPRELAWGTAFNLNGHLYIAGGAAGSCYSHRTFRLK